MRKVRMWRVWLGAAVWALSATMSAAAPAGGAVIGDIRGLVTNGAAEIVWTTTAQDGVAGFRVSRLDGETATALHSGWLPVDVRLNGGGETFRVRDPERAEGDVAAYRLEETLANGESRPLGEWMLRFERAPAAPLSAAEPALASAGAMPLQAPLSGPAAKVLVTTTDVFAVSYASLGSVLGLSAAEVEDLAGQAQLKMRCGDMPVAYQPDAAAQRLLFYGWPANNRYTRTNVFWIEPGAGLHMAVLPTEDLPVANDQSFDSVRDFGWDRYIHADINVPREDLFYWDVITSKPAGDATGEKVYPISLDGYAGGPVTVTARFLGFNDATAFNPDHRVQLYWNGDLRQTIEFEGQTDAATEFTVDDADVLLAGNELRMRGVLYPGQSTSYPLVEGYSVAYRRFYAPAADVARATDGGNARLGADRFADAVVLDVTDPHRPVFVGNPDGIPTGHSWPAASGSAWAFRERAAIPTLAPQAGGGGAWLRAATNRVDYVVIAPREFETPARELADYRASQGLRTALAFTEEIYDQFAGGLTTPDAFRAFLLYARQHWAVAPWLVVLAGRGHHDYLNGVISEPNHIPSLLTLMPGNNGLKPADGLFADVLGDDGVPDIGIGRIPARTVADLGNYVTKLKAYENLGPQPYHDRAVFVADQDDGPTLQFTATNAAMAAEAAARYTPEQWSLNLQPIATVRAATREAFDNGAGLINYTGHGTHNVIAASTRLILQNADFASLTGPQMPVFLAWSCMIARFDHMTASCMGEQALSYASGGAIAVYAPASLSWNSYAEALGLLLHRVHAIEGVNTLGLALVRARQLLGGGEFNGLLQTYTLLGDPAIKLKGGARSVPRSPAARTFAAWRWERFSTSELADPDVSGASADAPGKSWSNFLEYAHAGDSPGLKQFPIDSTTGRGHVEWTQRIPADDLEYRLWVTTDLRDGMTPAPPETTILRTPLPDGITERVTALIPFDGDQMFAKLEVVEK